MKNFPVYPPKCALHKNTKKKNNKAAKKRNTCLILVADDDSKTTAKDLESHEEATLPKEPMPTRSRIPMKLAPLKRPKDNASRRKGHSRRDSRDHSLDQDSLDIQRPSVETAKKSLDLKEVLKRSESMSPRHEKDWEQLSSKFNAEENVIDIDRLGARTLTRRDRDREQERQPRPTSQTRELILSGGGSIFLKSNRSRDTTPSHETGRLLEDLQALMPNDDNLAADRLKSILREKPPEDGNN